jgi:hypothetical protein
MPVPIAISGAGADSVISSYEHDADGVFPTSQYLHLGFASSLRQLRGYFCEWREFMQHALAVIADDSPTGRR